MYYTLATKSGYVVTTDVALASVASIILGVNYAKTSIPYPGLEEKLFGEHTCWVDLPEQKGVFCTNVDELARAIKLAQGK